MFRLPKGGVMHSESANTTEEKRAHFGFGVEDLPERDNR
jgi:hypothetical protein